VHGETGYIAEIGDIERMGKYAIELLSNTARYRAFSLAGRKRAVEMFNLDRVVDQYEGYYEKVLSAAPQTVSL
jgi:glycosyltransferase involved in cell wall biosynthesis